MTRGIFHKKLVILVIWPQFTDFSNLWLKFGHNNRNFLIWKGSRNTPQNVKLSCTNFCEKYFLLKVFLTLLYVLTITFLHDKKIMI